jgi:hypothetical protein
MFEEADADVLLLYDCCHSAVTTTSSFSTSHKGVTEVIAACGYETIAPEVGEHSFSNALAEVLAAASRGKPFSVAELHTRVLSRLKCWAPSFVKDDNGKRKEDLAGRLQYERQPRRTPIYSILCETQPRRSIQLAPLKPMPESSDEVVNGLKRHSDHSNGPVPSEKLSAIDDPPRKRKRPVDEVVEYPQVLLAIRLDKHELDLDAWKECLLRQLPSEAKEIKIEGIFSSFSTLLLLRIPVAIWNVLPENLAYNFVGFVTSENKAFAGPSLERPVRSYETQLHWTSYQQSKTSDLGESFSHNLDHKTSGDGGPASMAHSIQSAHAKDELQFSALKIEPSFQTEGVTDADETLSALREEEYDIDAQDQFIRDASGNKIRFKAPLSEEDATNGQSQKSKEKLKSTPVVGSYQGPISTTSWQDLPMRAASREATPIYDFKHLPTSPRDIISPPSSVFEASDAPDSPRSLSPERSYHPPASANEDPNDANNDQLPESPVMHTFTSPSKPAAGTYRIFGQKTSLPFSTPYQPSSTSSIIPNGPSTTFSYTPFKPIDLSPRFSSPASSRHSSESEADSLPSRSRSCSPVKLFESVAQTKIVTEGNFSIEEIDECDYEGFDLHCEPVLRPHEYEDAESEKARSTRASSPRHELNDIMVKELKSLDCDLGNRDAEDEREAWLEKPREKRRARRSSGSVQKRTLSQSIGSDTDDDDLRPVTFEGANEAGSSARRLRRKMGERTSLIFDDPPVGRIEEVEEPESCEEEKRSKDQERWKEMPFPGQGAIYDGFEVDDDNE